ncbi:MAG: inositol-3-phosphate synthase [Deltaproteobacteria bacterium]|nr:inositol-3-phosphate synthase [Deltaproteobacteria bacterium]MBI3389356.1 inositol-3-phosphate synthase [Deltaproteobacteria bacterium]
MRQATRERRAIVVTESPTPLVPPTGRLAVLLPGLGAVASTFIAGVELVKKGCGKPIGSLTQMGTIRLGKRTEGRNPLIKDFVPLAELSDLVFGGWDIFPDNAYQTALRAQVLDRPLLEMIRPELEAINPWPAVFDREYVKRLDGTHVKSAPTKMDLARQLIGDIEEFQRGSGATRMVMVWCGSTEAFLQPQAVHASLASFEDGLRRNDPAIAPSMVYAYAALTLDIPFANGAPNLTLDIPAMMELAQRNGVPVCGKDFKTGQTLMKTIIAPGLKARALGLRGWFSTNILGNRDGEVLDEPASFKTKETSKLSVLDVILPRDRHPDLYGDYVHQVNIHYYPPRGDNKEGWDNIDIFGWLGYPMQIKINFLCRDSILAAPLVLDLALFLDLAQRAGMHGIQEWLSFYFKSPQTAPGLYPEHDLFIQQQKLKNTLRYLRGEELITHLGREYYE